jgi:NAD(P)-dependent dehydrogenase (short-subunit alcohol dehydrogenase family)
MRLQGKTSIVTGAAHGIGRAIAEAFAREGAWVLVTDIDEAAGRETLDRIRAVSGRGEFLRVDVTDEKQIYEAVTTATEETGALDIVCNNAAQLGPWHELLDTTVDEWERYLAVNLMGTASFMREAIKLMLPRRSGSIVNIASVQGIVGARSSAAYTAAKHAIVGLTRSAAYDYGPHNIRVNAICPGPIRTRISPPEGSELHQRQISKTMLGRTGKPEEVAGAAVFLASDESSFITGAVIPVDGGWTAM